VDESTFRLAGDAAAEAIDPLEDQQISAANRRTLVRVVVRRALQAAVNQ